MLERVLVPLDGSEVAERALYYAEQIAGRLGSELVLAHVYSQADIRFSHMRELYLNEAVEAARRRMGRQAPEQRQGGSRVTAALLVGESADEIINYTQENDVDLIVMTTHSRPGLRRRALGSMAERVYRRTKVSCILVSVKEAEPPAGQRGMMTRIVMPFHHGGEKGEAILPYVGDLAAKLGMEVILLRAVPFPYASDEEYSYAAHEFSYPDFLKRLEESSKAKARDYLDKLGSSLESLGVTTRSEVEVGSTAEAIAKVAEKVNADLIAMPAVGQSAFGQWVFGSLAEKVLRKGNIPLLVVKPSEATLGSNNATREIDGASDARD